ncbi:E3 ubiquitin/ISG15 ligase TRIM25-like [Colossoma macropomum]|uniref:E3 ubiquitin/ISG15 ligase TRIM25-like n=1 Tax=Colossoma macropomum TaxID=42526 RepID=UPI001864C76F|nr:E3 ubiquitin/ISG15 ligase TRIM25-like [Colossoma macropomum]
MASISVDQDQFSCPVCLDLLKDPVTIHCGHSYCMVCINGCWDQDDQRGVYSCPQCRETFTPRPVLRRNNVIAEVVEKLKKTELRAASPAHCYAGPGDVECDFCTGRKLKAIKSCLMCLASFCETHLKPHYEVASWKNHKLVKASTRLREKICSQHDKLIEIYCRTDQTCICYLCMLDQHKGHDSVSAAAERTERQRQLKEMQSESQKRIQEKEKKLQELKQAVNTIKSSAQTAVEDSERIFTELICSIEKKRSEVTELIRAQEKTELSGAEELIEQLEQEIADLKRRDTELEQLSHTEDHIHFLQSLQSLCVSSGSEDSPNIFISQHLSFDKVSKSLSDLKKKLEEFCEETLNRISPHAAAVQILLSEPQTREDFLQYFCQLTLDPNTAHPHLILSEENRVVRSSKSVQPYSDHPERFTLCGQVLCEESVSGRCYWEVEWSSSWGCVYISVSYKGISRKESGNDSNFGHNSQSWSLRCGSTLSFYHNNIQTKISAPSSSRIGVYVDHSAGTLSFYSISDTITLLHTVHTTFTQPLYAGFWLPYVGSTVTCNPKTASLFSFSVKACLAPPSLCSLNCRIMKPLLLSSEEAKLISESCSLSVCECRKMASISVDQDQFSCPVCLDLLKDPVAIPCGHSYCKVCINGHWDQDDQRGVYSCPQCRETFTPRPVLRRNNMLAEVVEKLKKTELRAASPAHCYAGPGDVECDFCTGRKLKAIKSCLMCLASFCETHLKPHYEVPSWKNHKLVKASTRLREKICSQHDKLIEIYCRTDQTCICYLCVLDQHKGHDSVSAAAERTERQSQLKRIQGKSQQRIQEKEKKLQELKQAVNTIKSSAQTAVEDSERIFTELICSIEKKRSEVTELIRAQEKTELSGAEELIEQLEQEIADLKRRDTELEQLSHTEDHIHFLQSVQPFLVSSGPEESTTITVNHQLSFDKVSKSLHDLKKQLEEFCKETLNRISPHAAAVQILLSEPKTREDFLQYFRQMTLDPNTANCLLILSKKNEVVTNRGISQLYPDHPERFNHWWQVLCEESVSGRCYWEVEWSSEEYVYISVSYKGISRKGSGNDSKFGRNNQSWSLQCSSSLSFWHNNIETEISAPSSSRIGVYVDHRAGTLSFYSVSDTMTLLHTVHTTFTQPLYAGLWVSSVGSTMTLCNLK